MRAGLRAAGEAYSFRPKERAMVWETPIVTEVAVGLEVTSYVSGDEGEGEI